MTNLRGVGARGDAARAILQRIASARDSFVLDFPRGCRHERNLPCSWADGLILFGRDPRQVLEVDGAAVGRDPISILDDASLLVERSGAAIAVGYVSYDAGGFTEPVAASRKPPGRTPLARLAVYDEYFAWCPSTGRLVRHSARGVCEEEQGFLRDAARTPRRAARRDVLPPLRGLTPNFTPEGYKAAVAAAREFILSGDIYEVNVSQRFTLPCDGRLDDLYLRLREYNPAPYGAFISSPRTTILCSSPELFLRLEGGRVVTRPIKGTAKRREGLFEDDDAARALALSEKDNAELAMVVDLERNDLGRVCRFGTVKVAERARVETFARVHHLVSTIEGTLRGAVTLADLFRATFPGGSITGAPKIRAMQIIDELEPCRRGVYTGSIGYILPGGRAQFNIAIRTIVHEEGRLAVQVGGAVTADSDPDAEYEETLTKAEALFAALGDGRAELSRAGRGRDVS